jgi:hypothetical protein
MQSIKGFSNNSFIWSPEYVSHKNIVTRSFAALSETGHYDFTKRFFEKGEDAALKSTKYCRLKLRNHTDLFDNLPNLLNKPPIWWLMPWGGVIRKPKLDLQTRLRAKVKYSARFLKLLKSIEKNGLIIDDSFNIPVHKLIDDNMNTAYILQDGHHRSCVFSYLLDSGNKQMLKYNSDFHCSGDSIKVTPQLLVHKFFLPRLSLASIGKQNRYFCLSDTYKWFELAFRVVMGDNYASDPELSKLIAIHDLLLKSK